MAEMPRRALVTGAGKRLGRAMVEALAADGFDVAVHCHRSLAEAEAVAAAVRGSGRRAVVLAADLSREAEAAALVPAAAAALGPLGLLVNNASTFRLDRLETADRESWDAHLETNLRAPVVLARDFVRQLPPEAEGLIVNMLDQRVHNLTPNFLSYSVSRLGLWAATQVLARELAPRVRVNAIGPGPTLPAPGMPEASFRALVGGTPLRRGPTPEEIAAALRFIVAMPAMTGQMITLDGGQQLGWLTPGAPDIE
jgi:NAD(P)-dependent dehydrogenase (short-subunit alcohol dehydrogenase family)